MKRQRAQNKAIIQLKHLYQAWPKVAEEVSVIRNQSDYERSVALLDVLIDEVRGREDHPLSGLMEIVGSLIEDYEAKNLGELAGDPAATLKFLMAEHGLKQRDLPEIGSQGVVSEVLSGKRRLNARQIRALAKRFAVSPAVFLG